MRVDDENRQQIDKEENGQEQMRVDDENRQQMDKEENGQEQMRVDDENRQQMDKEENGQEQDGKKMSLTLFEELPHYKQAKE